MNKKEATFVARVFAYYEKEGRHTLPWRKTKDPYKILVSEIMLQQTQVDRVIPKYKAFLKAFPNVETLAEAPLRDVLSLWQGLGYNRRAKMLHACAQRIHSDYGGKFPREHRELLKLPGIGPYTASAVLAFAFGVKTPLIETNVRSAYLHHFFSDATDVHDEEILTLVAHVLDDIEDARVWYYALMDYGSYIKKTFGNPNSKSRHYTKQSTFKGSDRQIRGAIIRRLTVTLSETRKELHRELPFEDVRIDAALGSLAEEGMIEKRGERYCLP
jgi:A/G-specific adenine glycosylase